MKDAVKDALKRIDFGKDWWGEVLLIVQDGEVKVIKVTQSFK